MISKKMCGTFEEIVATLFSENVRKNLKETFKKLQIQNFRKISET